MEHPDTWNALERDQKRQWERAGVTEETLKANWAKKQEAKKAKETAIAEDMIHMHNEEAKRDGKLRMISEEELTEILDKMYDHQAAWDVSDEEEAEKWFEEQFEKIRTRRFKFMFPNSVKENPLEKDPWEALTEDKQTSYETLMQGRNMWVLDEE